ncbi:hypothetical protein C0J52_04653 [Blattella germanica]|nr:hypothetical protein C0J52_04653 [Blattella germanica]
MGGHHVVSLLCIAVMLVTPLSGAGVPDFYQQLPNFMTFLTTSQNVNPILSRVARQTKTSVPCCGHEKFSWSIITDEFNGCTEEVGDIEKKERVPCFFECAGVKLGICDNEGYLKKDEAVELSPKFVEGDEALENFVKQLAPKIADTVANIPDDVRKQLKCNIAVYAYLRGLHFHMELVSIYLTPKSGLDRTSTLV